MFRSDNILTPLLYRITPKSSNIKIKTFNEDDDARIFLRTFKNLPID